MYDIDENIEVIVTNDTEEGWGKSLKGLPLFTNKEIEEHGLKSGKRKVIVKTRDRGMKFMQERYLSSNDIYTKHYRTFSRSNVMIELNKEKMARSTKETAPVQLESQCTVTMLWPFFSN